MYRSEDLADGCIEIARNNVVSFSRPGYYGIANGFEEYENSPALFIPAGTDITGRGKPNVVVGEWSGGAHCCYIYHVFELGERVREVAAIDLQDSDDGHFADLDHDGIYELVGHDYTFAYWHTSFGGSPAPPIVLRFNGRSYGLALDLMRRPAPSDRTLRKMVAAIRAGWESEFPEPLLWKTMLDLIYTGHPDLAWKVVSDSWGSNRGSRKEFLREFCGQLANSPYFEQLRPSLPGAPCDFDHKYGRLR